MSYLVLARKWRPRTLDEVVGQEAVTRTLRNALSSGRIGHAFLLTGARGVGKTSTARILAKALNCSKSDKPTADPCGTCPSCLEITGGKSLDVQEIDGATNNSVDDVRVLREATQFNPARDRFRIWIIDEVHMLSGSAFNALLKTLEEPPPRVKFILATTEMRKLPETILSRCQIHSFRLLPRKALAAHLREIASAEKIEISDGALHRIAQAAEGSVRDALSLFDQVLAFTGLKVTDESVVELLGLIDRDLLIRASKAIAENDSVATLDLVEELASFGADYRQFARDLMVFWRDLLVLKVAPQSETNDLLPEDRARAQELSATLAEEDILRVSDLFARAEIDLRNALDPRVMLELTLLKAAQLRRLAPFSDLLARTDSSTGSMPTPPAKRPTLLAAVPPAPVRVPSAPSRSAGSEPTPATTAGSLIDRLRAGATSPLLASVLSKSSAEAVGRTVHLKVPSDFVSLATSQISSLEALAAATLGGPHRVEVVALDSPSQAPADETRSPQRRSSTPAAAPLTLVENAKPDMKAKKAEAKAKAEKDPEVQSALSLFGGDLVDVKPLD